MKRNHRQNGTGRGLISAAEIACFTYCPEQWRLQYGMELEPENRAALEAGTREHGRKAVAVVMKLPVGGSAVAAVLT